MSPYDLLPRRDRGIGGLDALRELALHAAHVGERDLGIQRSSAVRTELGRASAIAHDIDRPRSRDRNPHAMRTRRRAVASAGARHQVAGRATSRAAASTAGWIACRTIVAGTSGGCRGQDLDAAGCRRARRSLHRPPRPPDRARRERDARHRCPRARYAITRAVATRPPPRALRNPELVAAAATASSSFGSPRCRLAAPYAVASRPRRSPPDHAPDRIARLGERGTRRDASAQSAIAGRLPSASSACSIAAASG